MERRLVEMDQQTAFAGMLTPKDRLRSTGLYPQEEAMLKIFCLADNYPRQLKIERTGTVYTLHSETGAALLYRKLKARHATEIFGNDVYKRARRNRGLRFY